MGLKFNKWKKKTLPNVKRSYSLINPDPDQTLPKEKYREIEFLLAFYFFLLHIFSSYHAKC